MKALVDGPLDNLPLCIVISLRMGCMTSMQSYCEI